ncbi:hypothetical protein AB1K70_03950 [Bremerella sp. JC770]|uniref:hypothetical protein n=1 Tax=Bremerella sp. JC770 TaxID=3232137 RepID=UPI0034589A9E
MVTPEKRGRLLFLILAALIVVDRLAVIVLGLTSETENLNLWRSFLMPSWVIICVVSLWYGGTWPRLLLAFWSLWHGGMNLLLVCFTMVRMASITPPEQTGFFLSMSAKLFGFPLLHASFYVFTGLALVFSSSLKTFFQYQQYTADSLGTVLTHWIPGTGKSMKSDETKRQRLLDMLDMLNAEAGGGEPTKIERHLGSLKIHSGVIAFGDPQYVPSMTIPNIDTHEISISAKLWHYPSGSETVTGVTIKIGDDSNCGPPSKVGELGIDSAALVIADKADIDQHWTDIGKDRIGVISTAPDDTLLRMLKKRFQFKTVRTNKTTAEVVGPVSDHLELEIENYLKSIPEYAQFPFMHFYVQTNNSFDRANFMEEPWKFMPIGNEDLPLMFVCGTRRGDGLYDVYCRYSDDTPRIVTIDFIGEGTETVS